MVKTDFKYILSLLVPVLTLASGGCSSETSELSVVTKERSIMIAAKVKGEVYSRANTYIASGEVTTGTYYLTFPQNPSGFSVGTVNFDLEGAQGTGIVLTEQYGELSWLDVGTVTQNNQQRASFYLDNVALSAGQDLSSSLTLNSTEFRDRYKAGVFDMTNGSNDLLSGSLADVVSGTKFLEFTLNHRLSRLKFVFNVYNNEAPESNNYVDLSESTVSLSSMKCYLASYVRNTGVVTTDNSTSDLMLRGGENGNKIDWFSIEGSGDSEEPGEPGTNGDDTTGGADFEEEDLTVYTTQDFVLPPQGYKSGDNRPILTVTAKVGGQNHTFWGYLPTSMVIQPSEGSSNSYATDFEFLEGFAMTITVNITADKMYLDFQPVIVEDWQTVYTGTFQAKEGNNEAGEIND
ncbi:MAG: fimbrillin family protein [Muribaculaceae bacterium]|nr:fimbrillin family protein [Muribaculaceae bacterium]